MDKSAYLDLVAYALLATLSPLGFAATVAVIESGRLKAFAFASGFVAAQLTTCAVLVAVGASYSPTRDGGHPALRAVLELFVGLVLLVIAGTVRRGREVPVAASGGRAHASLERLRRLRAATALAAGLALGVGGPKRLVLTALAAASITASGTQTAHLTVLVVGYAIVATLLVWAPVVIFELVGDRVLVGLRALQRWLLRHQWAAIFYPLVALGLFAVVDALAALL